MEYGIIGIAAITFFIVAAIRDVRSKRKKQLREIRQAWGKRPVREYTYEEFESIAHYSKKRDTDFVIDDITWNDLDLDTIFMLLNNTRSSVGEEYLYHILRTPVFDENVLKERNRLIEFFRTHEKERIKTQKIFFNIGKTRTLSIVDYIDSLDDVERKSNLPHILMALLLIVSIAFAISLPTVGVFFLIFMIGNNVVNYYRSKSKIESYIITFGYIMKLLTGVEELEKINLKEIEEYTKSLKVSKDKFRKFRKNSHLLASGGDMGGSPLDIVMDYIRILFHFDIMKFNSMLKIVDKNKEEINVLLENLGILESTIAIGSFRESLPYYAIPDFSMDENVSIRGEDIYHPMIEEPVPNSIDASRSVLLTGSNASGKSTFLKTVALSAILSQTIYTCPAKYYNGNFFKVVSSMALRDDLMKKESYYIVEIKALKRILDETKKDGNLLCFIDEVLRGTNTVERIAASAQILKSLAKENVICFAATHDIELTYLMENYYDNYHFEEEVKDNDILFNYQLQTGRAESQNAIKLLSIIGYDYEIVEHAKKTATGFLECGEWHLSDKEQI